ncbi:hypothetical protein BDW02DRAFT_599148 [Decorospora gaudefroyi]|uniref:Uncharacterized protein n=1 Tax=Decorospora gaudefroyi TaxID=184978 RepID=A0A6A5KIU0_9PLEO|nr:hypothetical protein BDW02DRAFT_599148 [Decorospora gaudefroyi]
MGAEPAKEHAELNAAPLNFIYACSFCCASLADVYEGHTETVRGLSDGINPKERLVTRLFLANCCHVFCASHLEGGGPPFHPAGERPKAPCPVCIKEKGDSEPRDLYSIRGVNKGEYDPQIPPSWFTAPPIRLDGSGKEMEALRFQYLALVRYCQNTHATRKPMQNALAEAEKKLASMQHLASEEHAKVLALRQENERLRAQKDQFEAMNAEVQQFQEQEQEFKQFRSLNVKPRDLETFITNKTAIRHYLKLVPMLIDQNEKMRKRLASVGFAMPLEPVPNFKGIDPHAFDSDEQCHRDHSGGSGAFLRKTTSSHTAGRSAHTSGRAETASSSPFIQRPMKRQRLDSPLSGNMQIDHPSSREAMPPPPKPLTRIQSVRKMFPTLRKKFSHRWTSPVTEEITESQGDIQMCDNGYRQDIHENRDHPRDGSRSETPYMSGALPVKQPSQASDSRESQLLSSVGIRDNRPEFTFRASSPVKMDRQINDHRPAQLPSEPSYIRLMDGLSRDDGVELGLKDPRESSPRDCQDDGGNRQVTHVYQDLHEPQEESSQRRWGFGQPFMHQSPYGSSTSVAIRQSPPVYNQTNGYANRLHNQPSLGLTTPAPRRHGNPGHQIESVVSPFFRSSQNQAPIYSRSGFAEPQDSSSHSGAYRSQRPNISESQRGWREPRSLNGLSFFDSPVNSRNEPIYSNHGHMLVEPELPPRSARYQSRHLDSRGFIIRPETGCSPYAGDNAYSSSQNRSSYAKQTPRFPQAVNSLPSFNASSHSRIGLALSPMPSITPGRSPARTQPQWESLQRAGVRSSRNAFDKNHGNGRGAPSRNNFSIADRRNVRR